MVILFFRLLSWIVKELFRYIVFIGGDIFWGIIVSIQGDFVGGELAWDDNDGGRPAWLGARGPASFCFLHM